MRLCLSLCKYVRYCCVTPSDVSAALPLFRGTRWKLPNEAEGTVTALAPETDKPHFFRTFFSFFFTTVYAQSR